MGLPQGAARLFLVPLGLRGRSLARPRRRPSRFRFPGPRVPGLCTPGGGLRPELCRLYRSLVEDMRLDMGGTEDVDHAEGWFDAGSGEGCPLSPLDYAPMGEVRAKIVSRDYPGVLTPAGLLHILAWANDTVWLGGSPEDVSAIARARSQGCSSSIITRPTTLRRRTRLVSGLSLAPMPWGGFLGRRWGSPCERPSRRSPRM